MALTTKLEAVNDMLLAIGQAPVNALDSTGIKDVAIASGMLDRVNREVQAEGWWFNTDRDVELSPDVNGFILIPTDALSVDAEDPTVCVVVRVDPNDGAMKLWDLTNQTWTFDNPVKCKIIRLYDFEEIPEAARNYIKARAARRFQAQVIARNRSTRSRRGTS